MTDAMTLDERAALEEAISGGAAYLVVLRPGGGVGLTRVHPDGGVSAIRYGALLPQAYVVDVLAYFRRGSSHPGPW